MQTLASVKLANEFTVFGCSARAGAKLGRLIVTRNSICFHSNMLGFKVTKVVPLHRITYVCRDWWPIARGKRIPRPPVHPPHLNCAYTHCIND